LGERPEWIRVRLSSKPHYYSLRGLVNDLKLHTVCQEARCPNITECWESGTATFMILGDNCTRRCGFCAVSKLTPRPVDPEEPRHVGEAVKSLGLRHAVVTSVNRDDLSDGGAAHFAETIAAIRDLNPGCSVEVLVPDFEGSGDAIDTVLAARPDVLNHNVETVPSLYRTVRPQARYATSLGLLSRADRFRRGNGVEMVTKSGLMVGLGETMEEISQVMRDLRAIECDVLTIGQYLSPSLKHLPVRRWVTPEEFDALRDEGIALGFRHVESGPFVRSSYHAHRHVGHKDAADGH